MMRRSASDTSCSERSKPLARPFPVSQLRSSSSHSVRTERRPTHHVPAELILLWLAWVGAGRVSETRE